MKHRVAGKKLARDRSHRQALFKNLLSALILHGEIKTTESKAKVIQRLFEKLVTKSKLKTLHARRTVGIHLNNRRVVNKLVDEVTPQFKNRASGFTRIIRLGKRKGDDAQMVRLALVEKPEVKEKPKKKEAEKPAKREAATGGKDEKDKNHQKK
ncbi:MAG: 50S ribosomal protein L17 [Candidatus Marinimicrobia bacterium]|nr:50S ribosomal protein L17 [Candidatus Neomarinimicrobiota bacterium]